MPIPPTYRLGQTWRTANGHEVVITAIASAKVFQYPISAAYVASKVDGHSGNTFAVTGEAFNGDRLEELIK